MADQFSSSIQSTAKTSGGVIKPVPVQQVAGANIAGAIQQAGSVFNSYNKTVQDNQRYATQQGRLDRQEQRQVDAMEAQKLAADRQSRIGTKVENIRRQSGQMIAQGRDMLKVRIWEENQFSTQFEASEGLEARKMYAGATGGNVGGNLADAINDQRQTEDEMVQSGFDMIPLEHKAVFVPPGAELTNDVMRKATEDYQKHARRQFAIDEQAARAKRALTADGNAQLNGAVELVGSVNEDIKGRVGILTNTLEAEMARIESMDKDSTEYREGMVLVQQTYAHFNADATRSIRSGYDAAIAAATNDKAIAKLQKGKDAHLAQLTEMKDNIAGLDADGMVELNRQLSVLKATNVADMYEAAPLTSALRDSLGEGTLTAMVQTQVLDMLGEFDATGGVLVSELGNARRIMEATGKFGAAGNLEDLSKSERDDATTGYFTTASAMIMGPDDINQEDVPQTTDLLGKTFENALSNPTEETANKLLQLTNSPQYNLFFDSAPAANKKTLGKMTLEANRLATTGARQGAVAQVNQLASSIEGITYNADTGLFEAPETPTVPQTTASQAGRMRGLSPYAVASIADKKAKAALSKINQQLQQIYKYKEYDAGIADMSDAEIGNTLLVLESAKALSSKITILGDPKPEEEEKTEE